MRRRRERTLARLLRALLACTVLLFAAPATGVALEPLRDVSAWVALRRVAAPARASATPATRAVLREPQGTEAAVARHGVVCMRPVRSPAAVTAADQRYLYQELQTLRC